MNNYLLLLILYNFYILQTNPCMDHAKPKIITPKINQFKETLKKFIYSLYKK